MEMNLCLKMWILMVKSLAVFRDSCLSLHSFYVKKCQKSTVLEKNDYECIFDRFDVHVITALSSRPGKTPNTCIFAYDRFFTYFKNNTFSRYLKYF